MSGTFDKKEYENEKKEFGDKDYISDDKNILNDDKTQVNLSHQISFSEKERIKEEFLLNSNGQQEYYKKWTESNLNTEEVKNIIKINSKIYGNFNGFFKKTTFTAEAGKSTFDFGDDKKAWNSLTSKEKAKLIKKQKKLAPKLYSGYNRYKWNFKYINGVVGASRVQSIIDETQNKYLGFHGLVYISRDGYNNSTYETRIEKNAEKYKKLYKNADKIHMQDGKIVRAGKLAYEFINRNQQFYGGNSIENIGTSKMLKFGYFTFKVAKNSKNIANCVRSSTHAFLQAMWLPVENKDIWKMPYLAIKTYKEFDNMGSINSLGKSIKRLPENVIEALDKMSSGQYSEYNSDNIENIVENKFSQKIDKERNYFKNRATIKRNELEIKKRILENKQYKTQRKFYINDKILDDAGENKLNLGESKKQHKKQLKKKKKEYKKEFANKYKPKTTISGKIQDYRNRLFGRLKLLFSKKSKFIFGLILIALCFIGSCTSCVFGFMHDGKKILNSTWTTENETDPTKVEEWYKESEFAFYKSLSKIEILYDNYDEYDYKIDPAHHDYIALISYISTQFKDGWNFDEALSLLRRVFESQYELVLTPEERIDRLPKLNPSTGIIEYENKKVRILKVEVFNHGFMDCYGFYKNKLNDPAEIDWYEAMYKLIGNFALLNPPCEDWENSITRQFGFDMTDMEYYDYLSLGGANGNVYAPFYGIVSDVRGDVLEFTQDNTDCIMEYIGVNDIKKSINSRIKPGEIVGRSTNLKVRMQVENKDDEKNKYMEIVNPQFYFAREYVEGNSYTETGDIIIWNPETGDMKNLDIPVDSEDMKKIMELYNKYKGSAYYLGTDGSQSGTKQVGTDKNGNPIYYTSKYWFDCSGFVYRIFNESGIKQFPRSNAATYYTWCNIFNSESMAKPGDLVFFRGTTNGTNNVSHVGIYIGNGKFIHSSAYNPNKPFTSEVGVSDIYGPYWKDHYPQFGRLP